MADTTIYPYGTDGQLPSSIGVINDLITGGADKALSAEQGKVLKGLIHNINADNIVDVAEDGFYLIDADGNVVAQYTDDGWRVAELDPAYIAMLNRNISVEIGTTPGTAYDGGSGHELEQRVSYLEARVGETPFLASHWLDTTVLTASGRPSHDCTWVGDEFWSFNKPSDGGALKIYDSSLVLQASKTTGFYETWKDESTNNQLEMKAVDYKDGLLMVSNGKSTYSSNDSYAYIFYDPTSWKSASSTITFANCGDYTKLDFTELGYKCYTFFGSQPELVFVCTNLFGRVTLVRLGKGTNDLGKGTYTAAESNEFNGSWAIIKTWFQTPVATGSYAPHGGQYYNGLLYLATNDSSLCQVYRCVLNDSGKLQFDVLHLEHYNDNGNLLYSYIDGMAIKDGILYAQPLNTNGGSSTAILKANINIK